MSSRPKDRERERVEMGHSHNRHNVDSQQQHHEAVDGLLNLFTRANHDLTLVQHKLQMEFQHIYPDHANPMKLVSRIKKVQEDLASLKEQCRELLAAKQDLIDKARTTLVGNRSLLQRLQVSAGVHVTSDADDPAYTNFNQIIDEWTVQVRSRTADGKPDSSFEDINHLLFSAVVQGN